jgi:hypothetical protein
MFSDYIYYKVCILSILFYNVRSEGDQNSEFARIQGVTLKTAEGKIDLREWLNPSNQKFTFCRAISPVMITSPLSISEKLLPELVLHSFLILKASLSLRP